MHRILVDEKKWVEESRYLHALNFCMLLPGPRGAEARNVRGLAAARHARRPRRRESCSCFPARW
jgi:chromate transporter